MNQRYHNMNTVGLFKFKNLQENFDMDLFRIPCQC